LQVLYASQTGTAAKMANNFANEAAEHGFQGVVINLKDITH
jgi:sulfite reductase alpha subunit-like flavoprotein